MDNFPPDSIFLVDICFQLHYLLGWGLLLLHCNSSQQHTDLLIGSVQESCSTCQDDSCNSQLTTNPQISMQWYRVKYFHNKINHNANFSLIQINDTKLVQELTRSLKTRAWTIRSWRAWVAVLFSCACGAEITSWAFSWDNDTCHIAQFIWITVHTWRTRVTAALSWKILICSWIKQTSEQWTSKMYKTWNKS